VLEAHEVAGRERATGVETELDDIIAQAKEAKKLGKSLQKGGDKPRRRWFR